VGRLARGPALGGIYGNQVKLADGRTVTADDDYLRESILNPQAKLVAGWDPVMPTFQGQVSEEQITQLISYLRTLGPAGSGSLQTSAAGGQTDSSAPQNAGAVTPQN
jgi:cytochrome c oxidase subunit 2